MLRVPENVHPGQPPGCSHAEAHHGTETARVQPLHSGVLLCNRLAEARPQQPQQAGEGQERVQVPGVSRGVHEGLQPGRPHGRPQRRQAVQVHGLQSLVHLPGQPDGAPEEAPGGEAVPLHRVRSHVPTLC